MKLEILQEKFQEGLRMVERISSKSLTLPILNNILIGIEDNFLSLSATDLEIGIKWWSLAKIEKEGQIALPTRVLTTFISLLPEKKVLLETKNSILFLESGDYKNQIKGIPPDEFPIFPKISGEETILVNNLSFCQGLSQVVDIPILSTARPEISGIYFQFKKDQIVVASTDSFRLGEKKLFFENLLKEKSPLTNREYSFILPQKAAKEIINILGEKKGQLKIYFSPNQVMFEYPMAETPHPQIQFLSRLIEGDFPNYEAIIPKKFITQMILDKKEFLNQIKIASLFSGKINEVKFSVDPKMQKIQIFSQSPELGEHLSSLSGKIKGEAVRVSFNHRFLADGLLNIKSSEVIFELNGEDGPGVLKPVGDQSYIYVVMPIKAS